MHHVAQSKFGSRGNCFEACVASLLECGLADVPSYDEPDNIDMTDYLRRVDDWLRPRGLALVALDARQTMPDYVGPDTYWIAFLGRDGDDYHHAVVMVGGKLEWEPEGAEPPPEDLRERLRRAVFFVPRASPPVAAGD